MEQTKATRRLYRAWSMYDWANSGYNLVITSTIFPIYYLAITGDNTKDTKDYIDFLGGQVMNSSLLNYALALAYFIVAVMTPILSSIADIRGTKKKYMQLFCYVGGLACCGLFFFKPGFVAIGILFSIIAVIGYSGGIVFNNAYLPEIAPEEYQDKLSAKGYAYGYIGSVILQLICLGLVGISFADDTLGARLSFLLVGLWWIGFAQIPFRKLPDGVPLHQHTNHSILSNGFIELRKVWSQLNTMPVLKMFLAAFFFYGMGVQTVMLVAAGFIEKEIHHRSGESLKSEEMIIVILIIQLVAIVGAIGMARLSDLIGNIRVLMLTVLLWIGICIAAYFTHYVTEFYILAALVGLVMGGIQAMSRSTFSKMMPATKDTASYFSFYNVAEKVAIALGVLLFGLIEDISGNMRNSIFALTGFFILGLIFLFITQRSQKVKIQG